MSPLEHECSLRTGDVVGDSFLAACDSLKHHLAAEETEVLSQVDDLFTASEQADLLAAVVRSLPAEPRLQPWVAAALSPDHLEARLRNMAASLPPAALTTVLTQIHDGVDAGTWALVRARTPELASVVDRHRR